MSKKAKAKLVIDKADSKQPKWEKRNWTDSVSPTGYRVSFTGTSVKGPSHKLDLDPWVSEPYTTLEVSTNNGMIDLFLDPKTLGTLAGLLTKADADMVRELARARELKKKYKIRGL